jgi:heat shock protein HtpX
MLAPLVFIGVSALLFGLVGSLFAPFVIGAVVGILLSIIVSVIAAVKADDIVLRISAAEPATESEYRRLHNIVEGLCVTVGISKPDVYVIDDVAPNALVVAQVRGTDAIAVTTGLVNCVDRVQLEGVVAHLVSRLRSGDVATLTRMSVLFGAPVIVGEMLQRKKWRNGGRVPRAGDPADSHGALSSLAAAIGSAFLVTAYVIGPLMKWIGAVSSDVAADIAACRLTRYPPGLAQAIEAMSDDCTVTRSSSMATAHLWFAESLSGVGDTGRQARLHNLFTSHSRLGERTALLKEM